MGCLSGKAMTPRDRRQEKAGGNMRTTNSAVRHTGFDPRRLRADYVPTGFKGVGVKTRAVQGHPFGLSLTARDRQALIAFLRTL